MALDVSREDFEVLVGEELDTLPDDVVDGLVNVAILVQDRPDDGSLDLLGLYDGIALTRRSHYGFGELPDRILIFREPLLMICATFEELREQVHVTLVHEIAHFYGIDDAKLDELGWG
jgi:predicted Zn-dependent protease with MMP-like domain